MPRPYDTLVTVDRLQTIKDVQSQLALLNVDLATLTLADIDTAIAALETLRNRVDVFAHLNDHTAFMLSKRVGDIILRFKQSRVILLLNQPKRKAVYVVANMTLQNLAEDELGNPSKWPILADLNSIKYSTDLIDRVTVDIP